MAALFRTIVDADEPGFHGALSRLHPSPDYRIAPLVVLSKVALLMRMFVQADAEGFLGYHTDVPTKFKGSILAVRTQPLVSDFSR